MKNRGGFTIVETLIVLAVSSTIFVAMMAVFNGRQGKVEFSQGLRDIESHIQDVANDVRNGYYPSSNKTCTVAGSAISFSEAASGQGTSSGCVFLGKVMVFTSSTDTGSISAYSVAGLRSAPTLSAASPKLIGTTGDETKEDYKMPAGIKLVKDNSGSLLDATLGLFFDYNTALSGGSAGVLAYKVNANNFNTLSSNINSFSSNASLIDSSNGIKLCFNSGTSNQKGTINIKKGLNGLTTELLIGSSVDGCWNGVL